MELPHLTCSTTSGQRVFSAVAAPGVLVRRRAGLLVCRRGRRAAGAGSSRRVGALVRRLA